MALAAPLCVQVALVRAEVVDAAGVLVVDATDEVTFSVLSGQVRLSKLVRT